MSDDIRSREWRPLWRAGCAPFVAITFLSLSFYWLDRWVDFPDSPVVDWVGFGISVAVGVVFLCRIPCTWSERVAAIGLYVPVMLIALWFYALYFAMLVLGVFP